MSLLRAGPVAGARADLALAARIAGGAVFVVFGAGKFVNHASEVDSFRTYGLPSPDAFVYAIGVIEVVGGLLLMVGLLTRLAALVLAGDMVGAIIASGINRGELVSLTVAPAELAVCLYLVWTGPGRFALDRRPGASGSASQRDLAGR
jgi:putative oxidoreductase